LWDCLPIEVFADFDVLFNNFPEEKHEFIDPPVINLLPFSHKNMKHCSRELYEIAEIGIEHAR
jgi:hypothetical protein